MLKKCLLPSCVIFSAFVISNTAIAGNFYIGPGVIYEEITAPNTTMRGVKPRFTAGYGARFDDFAIGLEAFYIPGVATINDNHDKGAPSVKTTQEYGASLLPGYYITDSIIGFARLGVIESKFTGINKNEAGGQAGAGLEMKLSDHWDLRAEYIYTQYPSISELGTAHANEGVVSLIYRFYRFSC